MTSRIVGKVTPLTCTVATDPPCVLHARWRLTPYGQQGRQERACDDHLATGLRAMGLPALVEDAEGVE